MVAQRARTAKCARWAKKQAVRGAGVGFTQTKVKRKAANAKRAFLVQIRVKKRKALTFVSAFLVAQRGFEPRQTESESVVLPLHNWAISIVLYYYSRIGCRCQYIYENFFNFFKAYRQTQWG